MSIGERLDMFAKKKYGDEYGYKSLFAKDLGIAKNTLSRYINDSLTPGNSLHKKLREMGCDIEWLMTGYRKVMVNGEEISVADRDIVENNAIDLHSEKAMNDRLQLEELQKEYDELHRKYLQVLDENLIYKREISIMKDQVIEIQKQLIDMLYEAKEDLGNENLTPSSSISTIKKISVEV